MEWTAAIRNALCYIEDHLRESLHLEDITQEVHISPSGSKLLYMEANKWNLKSPSCLV